MKKVKALSRRKESFLSVLANLLFVFLILSLPHFYLPSWGILAFEPSKVFLFQTIMTGLLLLFLLNQVFTPEVETSRSKVDFERKEKSSNAKITLLFSPRGWKYFLLFFLWLVVSSALGIDFATSFWGSIWRRQGLIFWGHGLILALLLKVKFIDLDKTWLAFFISLSAFIQALITLRQAINLYLLHLPTPSYAGRIVGTFGQPNFLAGFLLITLPFSIFLLKKFQKLWQKSFFFLVFFLQILVIFITFSRGAIFSLTVMFIFWLIQEKNDWLKNKKRALLTTLTLLIVLILGFSRFGVRLPANSFLQNRLNIWKKALVIGFKRPIAGYGLENIGPILDTVLFRSEKDFWLQVVDRSHNFLLDIFLTSGLIGVLLFTRLILSTFKNFEGQGELGVYLTLSLLGFLLYGSFNTYSVVHWFFFWILLGL